VRSEGAPVVLSVGEMIGDAARHAGAIVRDTNALRAHSKAG
jgi:hypothetical protein